MAFEKLSKEIAAKKFAPVYYLYGEEPYFIDKLMRQIEQNALNPGEESFNKAVLYGNDSNAGKLLGELRQFPMMAERRLVSLREAQQMRKTEWDKLAGYLENPLDSTVFVISFKQGKKLDGRSKAYKAIKSKGIVFESKKLYDNQVGTWIEQYLKAKGYTIEPQGLHIMSAYLGANLGLIESELEKIFIYLGQSETKHITAATVFEMTNIDKDYNVFELINALGGRDHSKSHFIINQMMKNVKENPPVLIVYQIYQFFHKLTLLQSKKLSSPSDIGKYLRLPNFIAGQYAGALRGYALRELHRNLTHILEADLLLKGVKATHMSDEHVLKTLVYKLLN